MSQVICEMAEHREVPTGMALTLRQRDKVGGAEYKHKEGVIKMARGTFGSVDCLLGLGAGWLAEVPRHCPRLGYNGPLGLSGGRHSGMALRCHDRVVRKGGVLKIRKTLTDSTSTKRREEVEKLGQ